MKRIPLLILAVVVTGIIFGCSESQSEHQHDVELASMNSTQDMESQPEDSMKYEVMKSAKEWKQILSDKEYRILREKGTELPYMNEYYDNKKEGVYYCRACGQPLYSSKTKYESGTGWPSFWDPIKPSVLVKKKDESFFMTRTETVCSRCGSHLGHVFDDGPQPTGLRYCMNSAALEFVEMDLSDVDVENLPVRERMASN